MKSFVITGGLTKAYIARDFLIKNKIKAEVKRQPNNLKRLGCGYGVVTDQKGVDLLKSSGTSILGIIEIGD